VRSGPGEARTILLLHIISVRPSKQPLMVRTFLKVYMELGSYFLFLQEQIKDIIIHDVTSSHRPRLVVSRSTCPPLFPPHPREQLCNRYCSNKHTLVSPATHSSAGLLPQKTRHAVT
jgi:hypothetical protein